MLLKIKWEMCGIYIYHLTVFKLKKEISDRRTKHLCTINDQSSDLSHTNLLQFR